MAEIYVSDVGTVLQFTIKDQDNNPVNLAGATVKLYVKKPSNQIVTRTCNIVDVVNGVVNYTVTTLNDLWDTQGKYILYCEASWLNGNKFKSTPIIQSISE